MAYKHGIYTYEIPTKLVPPALADVGLPVVVGTAPVHTALDPAKANEPKLIFSYEQAIEHFGISDDWEKYTLSEVIYSQFALYQMAPIVLINVLDIDTNKKPAGETVTVKDGRADLGFDVIAESVKLTNEAGDKTYTLEQDYVLSYDQEGRLKVASVGAAVPDGKVKATYNRVDTSSITKKDIIGGIDVNTKKKMGLELVNEIYPRFRLVPGLIAAPGFSHDPEVAAIMDTKARNINGIFKAESLVDVPAELKSTEAPEWKNKNNITGTGQFLCWPKLKLGDKVYHFSTQMLGLINKTDKAHQDVPYKSPSNELLKTNAPVLEDGTEVMLGLDEANYLNGNGIITALNWIGGWKSWGNRTACYPGVTDVKDAFIPIRRMFDWIANKLILTYWQKIDDPLNKRLLETVMASANIWLNSLQSREMIVGGRVVFLKEENSTVDMMDGIVRFHVYLTPPSPAREIDFVMEYDVNYVTAFIEEMAGE